MDLRQLEYLVAIDDHGSFTNAARAVHVSQPSLSHGIRTLEASLGVELFTRLGRSVAPTPAGRAVIDAARRVVRDMADVRAAAAEVANLASGTLDLVALPTLAVDPLAALVGRFRSTHPGVVVRILEPEAAGDVERVVRTGDAEIGLTDITTGAAGLVRVGLGRQEIKVVSPPGSPASPVTPRMLAELPLVATPVGTSTRRLLDLMLARDGLEPNVAVESNHREAIVPLVLTGAGSALLPGPQAAEAGERGAVVRDLRPALGRRVGLVHRTGSLTPAARAFLVLATG